ncbi:MAG: hypothetical protein LBR25_09395 [Erysipelotrichaceae bacterium]|jgi:type VII secretion protein EssB|nr:hypothetical protein [Erysipelotrichaceae bacterium]
MNQPLWVRVPRLLSGIADEFEAALLCRRHPLLLDLKIELDTQEVRYGFERAGCVPLREFTQMNTDKKLCVLLALEPLWELYQQYQFAMSLDNLWVSGSFTLRVAQRSIRTQAVREELFLKQCSELAVLLLDEKGPQEPVELKDYRKHHLLKRLVLCTCVSDWFEALRLLVKEVRKKAKKETVNMNRRRLKLYQVTTALSLVSCLVMAALLVVLLFRLPQNQALVEGYRAYQRGDETKTVAAMKSLPVSMLSSEDLYILALASIKSEPLAGEQKDRILSSLALTSDQRYLQYWVYLGRKDTESAIDLAKQINDRQYLLYAYLKDRDAVSSDKALSGTKKQDRLKELDTLINELAKSLEEN